MKRKPLLAAAVLAAASFVTQAAQLALDMIGTPRLSQSFEVQLRLVNPFAGLAQDEQLLAFGFHLAFDANLVAFESFTPAAGWDDDSAHLADGIFSASTFPGLTNAGQDSVILATLRFGALGIAPSTLRVFTDASDFNQGLTYLYADSASLNASIALSPVPEPAAYALMAYGLMGLLNRNRHRSARA